jgi:hypothetical protein
VKSIHRTCNNEPHYKARITKDMFCFGGTFDRFLDLYFIATWVRIFFQISTKTQLKYKISTKIYTGKPIQTYIVSI